MKFRVMAAVAAVAASVGAAAPSQAADRSTLQRAAAGDPSCIAVSLGVGGDRIPGLLVADEQGVEEVQFRGDRPLSAMPRQLTIRDFSETSTKQVITGMGISPAGGLYNFTINVSKATGAATVRTVSLGSGWSGVTAMAYGAYGSGKALYVVRSGYLKRYATTSANRLSGNGASLGSAVKGVVTLSPIQPGTNNKFLATTAAGALKYIKAPSKSTTAATATTLKSTGFSGFESFSGGYCDNGTGFYVGVKGKTGTVVTYRDRIVDAIGSDISTRNPGYTALLRTFSS